MLLIQKGPPGADPSGVPRSICRQWSLLVWACSCCLASLDMTKWMAPPQSQCYVRLEAMSSCNKGESGHMQPISSLNPPVAYCQSGELNA